MPKLILKERGSTSEKTHDFHEPEITLGREETNLLVLQGHGVSRRHAKIFPEGGDFFIKDLGSLGGTKINGVAVPKNEKYILKNNDIITIDNFDIRFQTIDEMLEASFNEITDSDILEVKLLKKVLRALDRESIPSLEVLNGVAEGKKAFITDDIEELTIGRDPLSSFPIEEYVISRKHAKIIKKWDGIMIQDLGSKNGVYVNSRHVQEEFLHDGDRIALGTIVLMFRNPKEIDMKKIGAEMMKEKKEEEVRKAKTLKPSDIQAPQHAKEPEEPSYTGEALPEEEQKKLVQKAAQGQYPVPRAKKERIQFNAMELSILGVGVLVFLFALVMIVNVIF